MAEQFYHEETPAEIKDAKGLHLITMSTPNGQKAQLVVEELTEAYGTDIGVTLINIFTGEQYKDWFLRLNPGSLIPLLVDNTQSPPFPVFESSAIAIYLQKRIDTSFHFGFRDERESFECLQWQLFWHGTGANAQAQANFYLNFASEKVPFAIESSRKAALRVFDVLERRLSGKHSVDQKPRQYLVGAGAGKYSIADMGAWPWVKGWRFSGFSEDEMSGKFPCLWDWMKRIGERPAAKRAVGEKYDMPDGKLPDFGP